MVEREQGYDRSICVEPRLTCANLSKVKRRHFIGMSFGVGLGWWGWGEESPGLPGSTNLGIIHSKGGEGGSGDAVGARWSAG